MKLSRQIFLITLILVAAIIIVGCGDGPEQVVLPEYEIQPGDATAPLDPVTILDLKVGEGDLAEPPNTVSLGYIGTRIDPETGEELIFDQMTDRHRPFVFQLGDEQVIPGFEIGVTGMRVGGKRLVTIQPEMGYGDQQVASIPPNTTLQFLIELYEVKFEEGLE